MVSRDPVTAQLRNGTPSHDTFRRVFGLLDRKEFVACLLQSLLRRRADRNRRQGSAAIGAEVAGDAASGRGVVQQQRSDFGASR